MTAAASSPNVHELLARLAETLRPLCDPEAIMFTASRVVGERLDVSRAVYAHVLDGEIAIVGRDYVNGVASVAGRYPLAGYGAEMLAALRLGEPWIVDDAERDPRLSPEIKAAYRACGVGAMLAIGLSQDGRCVGVFGLHASHPRVWTALEGELARGVAEHVWAALERARAETARDESQARYAALFAGSPAPTSLRRVADGVILDANEAFLRLFGFRRDEAVGRSSLELGISVGATRDALTAKIRANGALEDEECTLRHKSGASLTVVVNANVVRIDGVEHVLATYRDVGAERRAEEAVRLYESSKERLRDLDALERLHRISALFLRGADPRELLEAALEAAIAITEADSGELRVRDARTQTLRAAVQRGLPPHWGEVASRLCEGRGPASSALEKGERVVIENVARCKELDRADAARALEADVRALQATPLRSRSGAQLGVISTCYRTARRPSERALRFLDVLAREVADILDLGERQVLLSQLVQAQKMEAVGQLTAGLAHNFNNLLGAILPALDLPVSDEDAPEQAVAREAAERARDLVRQLMTFARRGVTTDDDAVAPRALLERAATLSRVHAGRRIAIEVEADADLPAVRGGSTLEQALLNLVINACEAMAEQAAPPPRVVLRGERRAEGGARLVVSDNGPGISAAVHERLFQPFVTTKPPGQGTGLGLSVSAASLRRSGASLTLASTSSSGTSFAIVVPPAVTPTPNPGNQVLIVDDEVMIRDALVRILRRAGYVANTAPSVEDALQTLEASRPDIVLLDHSMPGMWGADAVPLLLERWPGLRIILMSGMLPPRLPDGIAGTLAKPATRDEIVNALRSAMRDEARESSLASRA